jgi:hypothetical protein
VPDPRLVPPDVGVRVPKVSSHAPGFVVAYRNHPVADAALGFPEPCRVAPLLDRPVTAFVVTTGAPGTVNESTPPNAVPEAFCTIAQK